MERLHIAVLPWVAFGHLLPFLELSRRIATKGHKVSFLSTPNNIKRLRPPSTTASLNFVELRPYFVEHLPPSAEATIDLPSDDLRPFLRIAYDALEEQVTEFLKTASPDWLICDYAAYWAPPVAATSGVKCAYLHLFNAASSVFIGPPSCLKGGEGARTTPEEFTVTPKWVPFESSIAYRKYEAEELFAPGVLPDKSGVSESYRFGEVISLCDFVIVRSCHEFETEWLQLLGELYQKPVVPAGFFPPVKREESNEQEGNACMQWLEKQAPLTVVYAGFGSEVKLSRAQVIEIALGLEKSGLPFIWAMRSPESWLPEGYISRVENRGFVFSGWAPQVQILNHQSIGGFLTHAGWNSVIEGLAAGLPLALLPLMFDQGLNARHLVEKGVGIEVHRDDDGRFTGENIAESLRLIMVEEQGEQFRTNAKKNKEVFGDENVHDRYVNELIKFLQENKKE